MQGITSMDVILIVFLSLFSLLFTLIRESVGDVYLAGSCMMHASRPGYQRRWYVPCGMVKLAHVLLALDPARNYDFQRCFHMKVVLFIYLAFT
jgi:hypothetical protein